MTSPNSAQVALVVFGKQLLKDFGIVLEAFKLDLSFYWKNQSYTFLGHTLILALPNWKWPFMQFHDLQKMNQTTTKIAITWMFNIQTFWMYKNYKAI